MSFTLNYTGDEINAILARANNGGGIDDELALKAPLASPALTGNPTAPTQPEEDNSTKVATTEYADRAADAAEAAAEAAAKEYTDAATGALYIIDTASGSIASFSDGADGVAMRSVVVNITPVQSGSGDPAPDNVRPISGWTGAEITRTGKNLFNKNAIIDNVQINVTNGTESASNDKFTTDFIPVKGGIQLYVSNLQTFLSNYYGVVFYNADKSYLRGIAWTATGVSGQSSFVANVPEDAYYFRMSFAKVGSDLNTAQIELGSAATDYEPYAGQTFPVTWETQAGEVYGGTIDVGSGELKVTHGIVDLGTLTWTKNTPAANSRFVSGTNSAYKLGGEVISDTFKSATYSQVLNHRVDEAISISTDYKQFAIHSSTYEAAYDAAGFKTAMSGHYAVYELATPVTYNLTPQQITSLLGQNNVWSNTGDTEVTYVADPKLYIAKMIGGGTLTLGSVSPLSINRPTTISEEDLEQAGEVNEAVEAAAETVLPAESGETEEEAQE